MFVAMRFHLEQFRAIWSHSKSFGAVCSHLEPFGAIVAIRIHLEPCGAIWSFAYFSYYSSFPTFPIIKYTDIVLIKSCAALFSISLKVAHIVVYGKFYAARLDTVFSTVYE